MKVWLVPENWNRQTVADNSSLCASSSQELTPDEMVALTDSGLFEADDSQPSPAPVTVKRELTPEEEKEEQAREAERKVEKFKEKKRSLLADMQMQQLHCDIMQTKLANKKATGAPDVKYCADFQNDLEKHNKNMKKTVQMMQKFCANADGVNARALPNLMDACEQLATKHKDIEHWAQKFGVDESRPATKKQKK